MSKKRLSVRKTMEILRLKLTEKRTNREVAKSVKCSPSTVSDCVARFVMSGLSWPLPPEVDDETLAAKLYYSGPLFPAGRRDGAVDHGDPGALQTLGKFFSIKYNC